MTKKECLDWILLPLDIKESVGGNNWSNPKYLKTHAPKDLKYIVCVDDFILGASVFLFNFTRNRFFIFSSEQFSFGPISPSTLVLVLSTFYEKDSFCQKDLLALHGDLLTIVVWLQINAILRADCAINILYERKS